jgi:hypothetical protein
MDKCGDVEQGVGDVELEEEFLDGGLTEYDGVEVGEHEVREGARTMRY